MPRLTDIDYLKNRAALREEWVLRDGTAFVMLIPTEQVTLHDYYEPAREMGFLESVEHRRQISRTRPSLPHQAGRAFARIQPFLDMPMSEISTPPPMTNIPGKKRRRVSVFSQVNAHIDPAVIAKIIIAAAKEDAHRDRHAAEERNDVA
ncbi:hypothetical protein [Cryobacterium sp. GrIS_2_6]|uniref:hypothetical protein n=1 Tax=Cryobacterium sp. GrIS_2_6 TaxID=3162785 RepID=UPI002DF7C23E|nr:hypothetical protein [Cryobacterium psychrotolerans]